MAESQENNKGEIYGYMCRRIQKLHWECRDETRIKSLTTSKWSGNKVLSYS